MTGAYAVIDAPRWIPDVPEDVADFWRRVRREPTSECWAWTGSHTSAGYGNLRWRGNSDYAHRVAYALAVGSIPAGFELDHLCRNRGCVRRGAGCYGPEKTECKHGHDMTDPANVYAAPAGELRCRTCAQQREATPEFRALRRTRAREQNALIARAARRLGLTKREYARRHGWGVHVARRVLEEAGR